MTTDRDEAGYEPPHASSPTDHRLAELQLYGYRPFQDEPDPRPLPEARIIAGAAADIFEALVVALAHTRLEPDLEELLWSTVNLFHRAVARIERELDDNEQAQKRSQKEQDGSEIRSVGLERLTAEGQTLIERRNSMEFFRDQAADHFERHIHSAWRPRAGLLQARVDQARQGRAVQAQRPNARNPTYRRNDVPRHPEQPCRQGQEARHPGLEIRHRRRGATAAATLPPMLVVHDWNMSAFVEWRSRARPAPAD
jgi:hypothetical protein